MSTVRNRNRKRSVIRKLKISRIARNTFLWCELKMFSINISMRFIWDELIWFEYWYVMSVYALCKIDTERNMNPFVFLSLFVCSLISVSVFVDVILLSNLFICHESCESARRASRMPFHFGVHCSVKISIGLLLNNIMIPVQYNINTLSMYVCMSSYSIQILLMLNTVRGTQFIVWLAECFSVKSLFCLPYLVAAIMFVHIQSALLYTYKPHRFFGLYPYLFHS